MGFWGLDVSASSFVQLASEDGSLGICARCGSFYILGTTWEGALRLWPEDVVQVGSFGLSGYRLPTVTELIWATWQDK
jgi:hypothetical protein